MIRRGEPVTAVGMSNKLGSFASGMKTAIIGSSGGIGTSLVRELQEHRRVASVAACSRRQDDQVSKQALSLKLDLEDEASIVASAETLGEKFSDLDLVIVATGILHQGDGLKPEKTWRAIDSTAMERIFRINTIGPALVAKHFLPLLARDRKSVFAALSARVGSIGDNQLGGWHAYRASKAALNMLIRNFAIELERRNPKAIAIGLHPGTTDTALSKPFQGHVPEGKLFSPDFVADRLLTVIDGLTTEDSGRVFAWDGEKIPF